MSFINKYSIFVILIIFCVLSCIECKDKTKKKTNSTQKVKKRNSSTDLVNSTKHSVLTTTAIPIKSTRNQKQIKKHKTSKNEVMKSAKQITLPSKPIINFSNGLSGQQRDKAVEIVTEVLQNTNKSTDLVDCIRKELDRELGIRSNVILSTQPFMEQSLSKISGTVVMQLTVNTSNPKSSNNEILVSVFGLMKGNELMEKSLNLMKRAQKLSPKIVDSLMSSDMKQEIQKLSTKVVRNAKSMEDLSDQLSEVLNDKFGPHWHTVVGNKNMMSVDNHRKSSVFFLNMDFGDMRVSVFK